MPFKRRKGWKELLSLYTNDTMTVKQRKERTDKEDDQNNTEEMDNREKTRVS